MKSLADLAMSHLSSMTTRLTTPAGGVLLFGVVAILLWSAPIHGQSANAPGTTPGSAVDMSIADRDPRAASLRRVEPGNAQFSFESRLSVANFNAAWSPFDPASPTATDFSTGLVHSQGYQYRSPGLRALIDRPEYVPIRGGGEVMIIPANTVFQLTLERPARPLDTRPAAHENFVDQRLDQRGNDTRGGVNPVANVPFPGGPAYPNLRLERIPVSDLTPIPHPSQMRFPQAAFPQGWTEPSNEFPVQLSSDDEPNAPATLPLTADESPAPQASEDGE